MKGQFTEQHRVDLVERHINFFSDFCASEDNFAGHENEDDDFRLEHTVNQAREQLGVCE